MRAALWLLEHFRVPESIVGDLVEEHSLGRSVTWVWRQVVGAIARMMLRDLRTHWGLAMRALLTGWLVGLILSPIRQPLIGWISGDWSRTVEGTLWSMFGFPVLPLPFIIVMSVTLIVTGWIIARLHRGHEMSMVLVYTSALLLFYGFGFANSLGRGLQSFGVSGLIVNSVFPFIVSPILIVIGGLLAGAPRPKPHVPFAS